MIARITSRNRSCLCPIAIALTTVALPALGQQSRPGPTDVTAPAANRSVPHAVPHEVSRDAALEGEDAVTIARRYAPVVKFDTDTWHLPMSAQRWFDRMLCGLLGGPPWEGGAYDYAACSDIDTSLLDYRLPIDRAVWGNPPPFGGSHDYPKDYPRFCLMDVLDDQSDPNPDYWSGTFGPQGGANVPVYFKIAVNPTNNALRIKYFWFYGYQAPCEWSMKYGIIDDRNGEHIGDWEHVMITTTPDRSRVEAVSYFQHTGHYTMWEDRTGLRRTGRGFETEYDGYHFQAYRPVVYPGRFSHGNYYDRKKTQNIPVASLACLYFGDRRDPVSLGDWWLTDANLVDLRALAEPWMQAEQAELPEGVPELWVWGPSVETCSVYLLWQCWKHAFQEASGTHPTDRPRKVDGVENWCFASCEDKGCRKDGWDNADASEQANWDAWCDGEAQQTARFKSGEAREPRGDDLCSDNRDARIFHANAEGILAVMSKALADTIGVRIGAFDRAIADKVSPCELAAQRGIDLAGIWTATAPLRDAVIDGAETDGVLRTEQADWLRELLEPAPRCQSQ